MRSILAVLITGFSFIACNGHTESTNQRVRLAAKADSIAKPQFVTLQFMVDGKPCLAAIDQRYKTFTHQKEFPLSLFITINTVEKDRNGHPVENEAEIFQKLQQDVISQLDKTGVNAFIGYTTMNGYRDLIFYIKKEDHGKVSAVLLEMKKKHSRIREFSFDDDPQWESVSEFFQAAARQN